MNNILPFLEKQTSIKKIQVPKGFTVCELGATCDNLVVLSAGSVKIYRLADDGRMITLYHVTKGESCVLTASCLINQKAFPAIAITEMETEGYIIPRSILNQWLITEPEWQAFIFDLLAQRMVDLILKVDELAFETLEVRLMQWFDAHEESPEIVVTHQDLAEEFASSREVISRVLKKMEQAGGIQLKRGKIVVG